MDWNINTKTYLNQTHYNTLNILGDENVFRSFVKGF